MGRDEMGSFGEAVWKNVFSACGIHYIPLCDIKTNGRQGPRLIGCDSVLPDLDISTGRRRAYMDAKCKKQYVVYRMAHERRHGIDAKYAEAYRDVMEINRQKAMLGIVELFTDSKSAEWSGTLLANTLNKLGDPIVGHSNQSHMVYWPAERFRVVALSVPAEQLVELSRKPVILFGAKEVLMSILDGNEDIQTRLF